MVLSVFTPPRRPRPRVHVLTRVHAHSCERTNKRKIQKCKMQKCKNAKLKIEPAPLRNQLLPGLSRMCVEHGKRKSHKVTKSQSPKSQSHILTVLHKHYAQAHKVYTTRTPIPHTAHGTSTSRISWNMIYFEEEGCCCVFCCSFARCLRTDCEL